MKNPNWTRDELILALELYFREPTSIGSKEHPEEVKLSRILNSLPVHNIAMKHFVKERILFPFHRFFMSCQLMLKGQKKIECV